MSVETREREDGNLGRRSLVRAGVWAIPVVSVAAAAPALAVSGTPTLGMPPGTTAGHRDNSHIFTFTLTLSNSSATATTGLQVHATVSGPGETVKSITSTPAANWTSGTDVTTALATTQIAAHGTQDVKLVVVTSNNPGTVTLTFTTSNGGSFSVFV